MQRTIILISFIFISIQCYCQLGQWTWMNGSNFQGATPVWGNQGVYAPGNTPGAIYEAEEWTDHQGLFWLLDDFGNLWKFDPTINEWAWMKGPQHNSINGIYGNLGVPNIANNPGGRGVGAPTWVDTAGNLWIFGGRLYDVNTHYGYGNDLWMYNIQTNEWTWEAGPDTIDNLGNYGFMNIEAATNLPPARGETNASWTDNNNNLWLFGGAYKFTDQSPAFVFNDLWKFDMATHTWVWMKGPSTANNPSVYGTLGVPDPGNVPSSRLVYSKWKDCNDDLWLFGGYYYIQITTNMWMLNDMWRYSIANNEWTWMGGTNIYNNLGNGSTHCLTSDTLTPPSRFENRACWTRAGGTHFEFFGGFLNIALDSTYNDLWDYNITNNKWTLMSGSVIGNQAGNYGARTVSSPSNMPPSRAGSLGWQRNDTLWIFGGANPYLDNYNDMWRFVIDTTCPLIINPSATVFGGFNAIPTSGCAPLTVTFSNTSVNGTQFIWYFGDGDSSTAVNPTHTYLDSGTYSVTLIAVNYSFCSSSRDTIFTANYIHVHPKALVALTPSPIIGCSPLTVGFHDTATNVSSLLWNFGDGHTDTAANPSHTYTKGSYSVYLIGYNSFGCNDTAHFSSIVVDTLPIVTDSFFAVPLTGCKPLLVSFTNTSINGVHYIWKFGDLDSSYLQNPTHTYLDSGVYTVTLLTINDTSLCGTVADTTVRLEYINVGSVDNVTSGFTASPMRGCAPIFVDFTNIGNNGNNFIWYFGDGRTDTTRNPQNIIFLDSGTYHVTLIANNSNARCQSPPDTATLDIIVDSCFMLVPNVFSPNGDGKNDFFNLIADGYFNYHLVIFNRWGMKIFESFDTNYRWNGRVKNTGGECPDGTYYYLFSANNIGGKAIQDHGYITLIR